MQARSVGEGQRLAGQVAVVTGGGGGIGSRACMALAREGAAVVVADLDMARATATAAEVEALAGLDGGRILGMSVDVRDEPGVGAMVRQTLDRFGRIDILVHGAGILRAAGGRPVPVVRMSSREWDEVLETNLKGTFLCNQAVLPAMIAQRSGQIVNLSSTSGRQGRALDAPYCASKFAVVGFSESLAQEVQPFGIKVHVLLPDAVRTRLWDQNGPVVVPGDALPPERVADLIVYLLTLPRDTILGNLVIAPFRARRRRTGQLETAVTTGSSSGLQEGEG